ncbi:hypothetical protein CEXT_176521 [Caerostris extrusa]|uniref:Uncharacterized protein n=1 Tax=Caerostris extrusa TaxID=172846 RepID=A0AAV4UAC3_CAEEX|nr:hypothetical protein CEXT_176521 [Caerostris extrusa]
MYPHSSDHTKDLANMRFYRTVSRYGAPTTFWYPYMRMLRREILMHMKARPLRSMLLQDDGLKKISNNYIAQTRHFSDIYPIRMLNKNNEHNSTIEQRIHNKERLVYKRLTQVTYHLWFQIEK